MSVLEEEIKTRWHHQHTLSVSGGFLSFSTESEASTSHAYSPATRNGSQAGLPRDLSSSATPENPSQDQPRQSGRHDKHNGFVEARPPDAGVVLDMTGPNGLKGFVIFAVQGAKRLQTTRTRLAQIDIGLHHDDDNFFNGMKVQYQILRGSLRRVLSIWTFMTCEFVEVCIEIAFHRLFSKQKS